jgi:hypothetical protein
VPHLCLLFLIYGRWLKLHGVLHKSIDLLKVGEIFNMINRLFLLTMLVSLNIASTETAAANSTSGTKLLPVARLSPAPVKQVADNASPRINLKLKQEGQRLYAYVVIQQPYSHTGKIQINWTPPRQSSCDKSSYILAYQGKKFHTRAYRTLGYKLINGKSITCTGLWQATVRDAHGVKLMTKTLTIKSVATYVNAKMQSLATIA